MKNCKPLGIVTQQLIPDIFDKIDWNGIWNRKLETGTAFEWTTFAALVKVARDNNIEVTFPLIEEYNAGDFFVLRNEIPLTHGAQAGNTATALSSKDLKERFLYSLVPKAVFKSTNNTISVFREGCPYHKIMCGKNYLERTDIIFVPGNPSEGYPKYNSSETEVLFSYNYPAQPIAGNLRVLNSAIIPCRRRSPRGGLQMCPSGIVECSVNKAAEVATEQLQRYDALFSTSVEKTKFSLITGNDLSFLEYDTHLIDLTTEDISILLDNFIVAAEGILKNFSIIVP